MAHDAEMRPVSPNCLGVVNTDPLVAGVVVRASQAGPRATRGRGSVGAVAIAVVEAASRNGLGVANVVSLGNMADVSGNDLLLGWWHDDRVRVIALDLESLGNPRKFAEDRPTRRASKPALVVKAGRSDAGRGQGVHTPWPPRAQT